MKNCLWISKQCIDIEISISFHGLTLWMNIKKGWSMLIAGMFVANRANMGQEGTVVVTTAVGPVRVWWHRVLILPCDLVGVFKRGDNIVSYVTLAIIVLRVKHWQLPMWQVPRIFSSSPYAVLFSSSPLVLLVIRRVCHTMWSWGVDLGNMSCPV